MVSKVVVHPFDPLVPRDLVDVEVDHLAFDEGFLVETDFV